MANVTTTIAFTGAKPAADLLRGAGFNTQDKRGSLIKLAELLDRTAAGFETAAVEVKVGGTADVRASATATCASVIATNTLVIGKTTLTAVANAASPTSVQFRIGASGEGQNAECAANIAAAINANTTLNKLVSASAAAAVVTVTALQPGIVGNQIAFSSTGGTITCTGSGYLASGAGRDAAVTSFSFP